MYLMLEYTRPSVVSVLTVGGTVASAAVVTVTLAECTDVLDGQNDMELVSGSATH